MDVWGQIFRDHRADRCVPHIIERDDGLEHMFESAAQYFEPPQSDAERQLLGRLEGPVLDLGAGAGSCTLHLQAIGLSVTAADVSPGALAVCRARGCLSVRSMDICSLALEPGAFQSVIIMGNTLGAHQTPETFPEFLSTLRRGVGRQGRLLCSTVDPVDTTETVHLRYHKRNRDRGLPPGLTRIRLKYQDMIDDWMYLWMPTGEELAAAASTAGWNQIEERREGARRVRLFESTTC